MFHLNGKAIIVVAAGVLSLTSCGEKTAESALQPGRYAIQRELTEGNVAPVLPDQGEFTLLRADGSAKNHFLDLDATVFSDATAATLATYRWRIEAPMGVTQYARLTQGYDNESIGVYRSYELWDATISLDNRTHTGTLTVSFRSKFGDDETELFTRERFRYRRTGGEPAEDHAIDDPYILEYRHTADCYHMITEWGSYTARFVAFPDLRLAMATSDWECNVDIGYASLTKATYTTAYIDHAGLDFHGAWQISAGDISETSCGPVRFFKLHGQQHGQVVTADSFFPSCPKNGGVIYHRWSD